MSQIDNYHKSLEAIIKKLDEALGSFDYLQYQISEEIDMLSELRGEVCERADKVANALDLNREVILKHKENQTHENHKTNCEQRTESPGD